MDEVSHVSTDACGTSPPGAAPLAEIAVIGEHWDVPLPVPVAAKPLRLWEVPLALAGLLMAPGYWVARIARTGWPWLLVMWPALLISLAALASLMLSSDYELPGWGDVERWLSTPGAASRVWAAVERRLDRFLWELQRGGPGAVAMLVSVGAGCVLPVLGGALGAAPFITAGEGRRRTYAGALTLLCWSWPAEVVIAVVTWVARAVWMITVESPDSEAPGTVAMLLGVVWWAAVIIRMGARYAGPPVGPGFAPCLARCGECGYQLATLKVTGNCPECGRPVARSQPEARRPIAWATARGVGLVVAYWRTWWAVLADRSFFRDRAITGTTLAAQRFAWTSFSHAGLFLAVGVAAAWGLGQMTAYSAHPAIECTTVGALAGLSLWGLLALTAIIAAIAVFLRVRVDPRPQLQVLCYSTGPWVFLGLGPALAAPFYVLLDRWHLSKGRAEYWGLGLTLFALLGPLVFGLVSSFFVYLRGCACARYVAAQASD